MGARFESAFTDAPIGMALLDREGLWLEINDALCRITGYSRNELTATTLEAITHPDDVELDSQSKRDLLRGRISSYQIELRYRHALGRHIWVLVTVSLARDEDQKPLYMISQAQDIPLKFLENILLDVMYDLPSMEHVSKDGSSKLLKECTLPLTGKRVVDLVISELGVFTIDKTGDGGVTLIELADETRRSILQRLSRGRARVTEVAAPFDISLNSVSKHIRILERAGLVRRQVSGRDQYLSLDAKPLEEAADWLAKSRDFWTARLDSLERGLTAETKLHSRRKR